MPDLSPFRLRMHLQLLSLLALFPLVALGFAEEPVSYTRDIKPLLRERCYACHGVLKTKAGLRLDAVALMRDGGDNGPAIVPGKASESPLVQRLRAKGADRMPPPDQGEALTETQIALLTRWIDEGAKAPAKDYPEEDPRNHWAFRPPVRPDVPKVHQPGANPIDAFVAEMREKNGLAPQPLAPKETLLRRVYLDLVGLPPTRDELHRFLADTSPDAWDKVVDHLLNQPQYGERWGRHWMDVWRYSDWYGRRSVNDVRNSAPQIWRWRDWIVTSLNEDRGYDRMVQDMLAADELRPEDEEAQVATGYLVRNWYSLNPHQWMRDNVEHTGKAFLGLTFHCAHCHDHKYDPIAHEDYFRFRAYFEPLGLRQDRVPGEPDPGPFEKYDYTKSRKPNPLGRVGVYDENPKAATVMYLQGDERQKVAGKKIEPGVPAFLGAGLAIEPVKLPPSVTNPGLKGWVQKEERAQNEQAVVKAKAALEQARKSGPEQVALAEVRVAIAEAYLDAYRSRLAAERVRHKQESGDHDTLAKKAGQAERRLNVVKAKEKALQAEHALKAARAKADAAADIKAKDAAGLVVTKAEAALQAARKAVEAAETALKTDASRYSPFGPEYASLSTGRRKALALWITNRQNPLTARVAVNHLWLRHFDRPLVDTVFDFGRNGKKSSHPELLDWLAVEFQEHGWSMKHLHRLIVTSHTYRLVSTSPTPEPASDPDNRFLWRFPRKRMEAEVVRDSLLHLAGTLDLTRGGPPIDNKDELTTKRRSLYFTIYPEDGGTPKFLEIFDAPDACDCYKRTTSIIPQQALALVNNPLALAQSRLLARKLNAKLSDNEYLTAAFETVLCRRPTAEEKSLCREFLEQQRELFRTTKDVELKGTPSPLAPSAAVDVNLRARESFIRVLFSHNDFVTIR